MGRIFTLVTGVVAAAVTSLTMGTLPAVAASRPVTVAGPVTAVIKHGIYKAVVVCPRWNGPAGGPAPLLAAPLMAKSANPRPGRVVPQPVYTPLVTCAVTFLKDGPGKLPARSAPACHHGISLLAAHHRVSMARGCCASALPTARFARSCLTVVSGFEAGFGGMARQVSRHVPRSVR